MTTSMPQAMRANGNITRARFVKMDRTAPASGGSSGNNVVQCGLGGETVGISQVAGHKQPTPDVTDDPPLAAIAGENVGVHVVGAYCQLEIGSGGCTAG